MIACSFRILHGGVATRPAIKLVPTPSLAGGTLTATARGAGLEGNLHMKNNLEASQTISGHLEASQTISGHLMGCF